METLDLNHHLNHLSRVYWFSLWCQTITFLFSPYFSSSGRQYHHLLSSWNILSPPCLAFPAALFSFPVVVSFIGVCTSIWSSPHGSEGKESTCNAEVTGDTGLIPGSRRSPEGRHGNPFQYSCLENPHGFSWATVHRVAKSWTWLKWLAGHTCMDLYMTLNADFRGLRLWFLPLLHFSLGDLYSHGFKYYN